ncbi:MAG: tetratricopeptide repeat protein [Bacteroidota bacterium]
MKKNIFLAVLLSLHFTGFSQKRDQDRIDSLLVVLSNSKEDSNKVEVYAAIMATHIYHKIENGLAYREPALTLAKKIGWVFGIATIEQRTGRLYWRLGNFEAALKHHFEARKLYVKEGRHVSAAYVLVEIGQDYLDNSKYAEAETWLYKAIKESSDAGDKSISAQAYDKLNYLYTMQGNLEEASKASYAFLKINEETGNKQGIVHASYTLGFNARLMGNNDDALKYFKKGLLIATETGDKMYQATLANLISDLYLDAGVLSSALDYSIAALKLANEVADLPLIANCYRSIAHVYHSQGKYDKALTNYQLAEIKYKVLASKVDLASLYSDIGMIYTLLRNYPLAKRTFENGMSLYKQMDSKQRSMITYYDGKRQLDSATGNWKDAYHNYQQYVALRDSSFNKETLRKLVTSKMQYEAGIKEGIAKAAQEKKDLSIQEKMRRQRNILTSAFALLAVVLVFSVALFRQRNKIAKEKERSDELLTQNELLLKEIHHRVKNNLEVVSSLLALQSAQIEDQHTKDAMLEGQNRVQSIGIVHQKLYQGTNLGAIEMKDYFINLSESILDSFGAEKRVSIECAMNQLDVDIDTAVPLGLIVNELLTNTLKYAFPAGQHGNVLIKLEKRDNGVLHLQISDDGIGKSGITHGTGFGGQLVSLLTQQLSGSMREEIKDGTHIYFEFKPAKAA